VKLSVAIIAHNEADNLPYVLNSIDWVDQIVVIDCSSSDNTAEIARQAGADVYSEPNHPNLNINKNLSIDYCHGDWILVLDADENIPYDLAGLIRCIINEDSETNGYLIPRRNYVLGRWLHRGSQYPDYQLRLFRRGKGKFPAVHVHERIVLKGKVSKLELPFEHHPYRTLDSIIAKNRRYVEFEARFLYENGKRVSNIKLIWRVLVMTPLRFFRRYILKGGILDGVQGLMLAWFDAVNQVQRWFRLWELQRTEVQQDKQDR